jgi:hypothetical protein
VKRLCLGLAGLLLVPAAAVADGQTSDCGGEAYSYAEVVPSGRGEPLIAAPNTLCADLAASQSTRIESLNIYLDRRGGQPPPMRLSRPPMVPHSRH